jgi:Gamma-glutamyl cyclotransferase, AIG2-like
MPPARPPPRTGPNRQQQQHPQPQSSQHHLPLAPQHTLVFSYGSNSLAQLRVRVDNPSLTASAATLPGYARVFCLSSPSWGRGGVASLAPAEGAAARGSVVALSPAELARLDAFEGGYRQERLMADVRGAATPVVAYIAGPSRASVADPWTRAMTAEPTEMYLAAVRIHLRENWPPEVCDSVEIASWERGRVVRRSEWVYPGVERLGMEALLVEANYISAAPWVDGGPSRLTRVVDAATALRKAGIGGAAALRKAAMRPGGVNGQLRNVSAEPLCGAMLDALLRVCGAGR